MANYVLGLDLGPTSVGWSAIAIDPTKKPGDNGYFTGFAQIPNGEGSIPAIGSRIFEAGIDNLGQGAQESPKNKPRREKRSIRRSLRRKKGRRLRAKALLVQHGILTVDSEKLETLNKLDPYELRSRGLTEKLELEEFGRIVLHISKRRGFKSNRKQPESDKDSGPIKEAMKKLETQMGDVTLGHFWYELMQTRAKEQRAYQSIRNRRSSYQWIAKREHYQEELALLFERQSKFYPEILTEELFERLGECLFFQQRFELSNRKKKKVVGMCSLMTGQLRCSLSNRKAQEFRLLQKINDLLIIDNGQERALLTGERQKLYAELMSCEKRTFKQIRKLLKLDENVRFNFENPKNDKLIGNKIDSIFAGINLFSKQWLKLTEEDKQEVWDIFLNDYHTENSNMTLEELSKRYEKDFGLVAKKQESLENIAPPVGNINYCEKVLDKILPAMRGGKNLYEAIRDTGFEKKWRCLKKLPLPDKANGFQCNNPIVKTTLFQVRKVVNALIRELGKPRYIVIETARDFKANAQRRQEIIRDQNTFEKERVEAEDKIREYMGYDASVNISSTDILKWRLWEQQARRCPYSLKPIPIEQLLSRNTEIDHILPYSMSLDNSMHNKVVCYASENQDKKQRTPIDWLGEDSLRLNEISQYMKVELSAKDARKWERFFVRGEDIGEKYTPERLLRDTSYIATEAIDYLKRLYPYSPHTEKYVKTTKGGITSQLRHIWQLDPILRDGEEGPKNRDDLRHHAVDAAVVALTNSKMLQKITRVLQAAWPQRPSRVANIPMPWRAFGEDLAEAIWQVKVSHRVQRKVKGQLHEETIFNKETHGDHSGKFVTRAELSANFSVAMAKRICDNRIKELVFEHLEKHGNDPKKAFTVDTPLFLPANESRKDRKITGDVPIKTVRLHATSNTMMKIKDNIWVKPGSNHHVEVFKAKVKGKETLIRKIYSTWEVAQRLKELANCDDPEIRKTAIVTRQNPFPDDPTITDVGYMMSLSAGESVLMKGKDGQDVLARVGKISYGSDSPTAIYITFLEHQLSRVQGNITSKTDNAYCIQTMSNFKNDDIKKVTVDPLGRVRWAND